jgi:hypothetical protein
MPEDMIAVQNVIPFSFVDNNQTVEVLGEGIMIFCEEGV